VSFKEKVSFDQELAMHNSRGFTLIELLVTVAILVILLLISIISVNQSADRRYPAEAEKMLIWLQQISQRSMLEGAAYGIVAKIDENAEATFALHPVIYYRKRWVEVTSFEPFTIQHNGLVYWNMESEEEEFLPQTSVARRLLIKIAQYLIHRKTFCCQNWHSCLMDIRSPPVKYSYFLSPIMPHSTFGGI
jgi:prepilin-type N-terminal cleavage/methylation domain-containing protein